MFIALSTISWLLSWLDGGGGPGPGAATLFLAPGVVALLLRRRRRAPGLSRFLNGLVQSAAVLAGLLCLGALPLALAELNGAMKLAPLAGLVLAVLYLALLQRAWRTADARDPLVERLWRGEDWSTAELTERPVRWPAAPPPTDNRPRSPVRRRPGNLDPSWDPHVRTYGVAGAGISRAGARFGQRNVLLGAWGEQITGGLLEFLCVMPGVRIVHGLHFPGSTHADIDHAVIAGNRVALIDSKLWQPALYELDRRRQVLKNRRTYAGFETSLGTAVERMRLLVPTAEVQGWIVVHPNARGSVGLVNSCTELRLVNAQGLLHEVGDWLAAYGHVVDRHVLQAVLDQRQL